MNPKKASIGIASLALALSPALAQANPTGHGKPESTHGNGTTQRSESGTQHSGGAENQGKSHAEATPNQGKCSTHEVAYIAAGTLVSDTLTKSEQGNTYSGEVTVEVSRTNHKAAGARGKTETYTVQAARVRGPIAVEALKPGDRAKLIGKITSVAPKCESSASTPTITITKLVFHAPHPTATATPSS